MQNSINICLPSCTHCVGALALSGCHCVRHSTVNSASSASSAASAATSIRTCVYPVRCCMTERGVLDSNMQVGQVCQRVEAQDGVRRVVCRLSIMQNTLQATCTRECICMCVRVCVCVDVCAHAYTFIFKLLPHANSSRMPLCAKSVVCFCAPL